MRPNLWIFSLLLLLAPLTAPAQHTVLVKADSLTLREKPARTAKELNKLLNLQPVELLKEEGDWAQVKTAQNQTGYVLAAYLTKSAFVYTEENKINGRYGPGTQYDVIIEYTQPNMPLRVLDTTGNNWIMVMDYEGDRSWIFSKNVSTSGRYVITKEENSNVRKGVGIGQDLVFTAQKGVIFRAIEEKEGWLHVKHADGDEGWLSAKLVFGWNEVPAPATKSGTTEGASKNSSSSSSDDSDAKPTVRRSRRSSSSSSGDSDGVRKTSTRRTRRASR